MGRPVLVDLFVEDIAHEELLVPMLQRIAMEERVLVKPRVRSARGGHGRAIAGLRLYQEFLQKGVSDMVHPHVLIVGIDGNCSTFARAKQGILAASQEPFTDRLVVACPDPHIERWYMADPQSFRDVVGSQPRLARKKCQRDYYKDALVKLVAEGGHPPTLGGIQFAQELVDRMDLYRASKNERSLKSFLDDLRAKLKIVRTLT